MIRRISAICVRTKSGNDERIRRILAHAANIGGFGVYVTASADLSQARNTADDSLTTLGLMIGVIALIVGGMSIANMMIVTVMERRDEIGLRLLWHRTTDTRQICGVFRQPDMKWRYIETIILD